MMRFSLFATLSFWGLCACAPFSEQTHELVPTQEFLAQPAPKQCSKKKPHAPVLEHQQVHITKIADGDTFTACFLDAPNEEVKVRILGMDCPESIWNEKCERDGKEGRLDCKQQVPLGQKARKRAIELLEGQMVELESPNGNGVFEDDDYHRVLAYVRMADGQDYGELMIGTNYCDDFSWRYPHPRQNTYRKAQQNRSKQ